MNLLPTSVRQISLHLMKLVGALLLFTISARAGTQPRPYSIEHTFGAKVPPNSKIDKVEIAYYLHAWVLDYREDCPSSAVKPLNQPAGYLAVPKHLGTDKARDYKPRRGLPRNNGKNGYKEVAVTRINIPKGGQGEITDKAEAYNCVSDADAGITFHVNQWDIDDKVVNGSITTFGNVITRWDPVSPKASQGYSFSWGDIFIYTSSKKGNIARKHPITKNFPAGTEATVYAPPGTPGAIDPVTCTVIDLVTGDTTFDTLYSVDWLAPHIWADTPATLTWVNDTVKIGGREAEFAVNQSSLLVTPQGSLRLVVSNGQVSVSDDNGIFDGKLPIIGTPTPLAFELDDSGDFAWDVGDFDGHDVEVIIEMDGGGMELGGGAVDGAYLAIAPDSISLPESTPIGVQRVDTLELYNVGTLNLPILGVGKAELDGPPGWLGFSGAPSIIPAGVSNFAPMLVQTNKNGIVTNPDTLHGYIYILVPGDSVVFPITLAVKSVSCCIGVTGNVNNAGIVDLGDLSALVSYLTGGGYVFACSSEANINAVGIIDLSDLSAIVSYLTGSGYVLPNCP